MRLQRTAARKRGGIRRIVGEEEIEVGAEAEAETGIMIKTNETGEVIKKKVRFEKRKRKARGQSSISKCSSSNAMSSLTCSRTRR